MVACKSNLKNVGTALEMYKADHKAFPKSLSELSPQYLKVVPVCPAARTDTYSASYSCSADGEAFTVFCQGRHHEGAGLRQDNYPQYNSQDGVVERSP